MKKRSVTKSKVFEALQTVRSDFPLMGEVVSWSVIGFSRNTEELRTAYEELELPEGCFTNRRAKSALTKSLKELETSSILRKAKETDTKVFYRVFVEEFDRENEDIDLRKKDRIIFDKITHEITIPNEELLHLDQLKTLFEHYKEVTTGRELASILIKVLHQAGSLVLHSNGGTYFIPKAGIGMVEKLEKLLEFSKASIFRLGVVDNAEYKIHISELARRELTGEVRKVKKEIDRMESDTSGVKEFVLNNRLDKIQKLRDRVSIVSATGVDLAKIDKSLLRCKKKVKLLRKG